MTITHTGHSRAQRLFPMTDCEKCGGPGKVRHHKDGNQLNNDPTNIARLCHRCHMDEHGIIDRLREAGLRQAAVQAARTNCPRGHPYDDENTYTHPVSGKRSCRACRRREDGNGPNRRKSPDEMAAEKRRRTVTA